MMDESHNFTCGRVSALAIVQADIPSSPAKMLVLYTRWIGWHTALVLYESGVYQLDRYVVMYILLW